MFEAQRDLNIEKPSLINASTVNYSHQSEFIQQSSIQQQTAIIKEALSLEIARIQEQVSIRELQLAQISTRIKTYYEYQNRRRRIEIEERKLQGDLEDLQFLEEKLKKQLRLLIQQQEIKKGKLIVDHNKITEIKEEQNSETKRKDQLAKQVQEISKGVQGLRRKIKNIKDDIKRKYAGRNKVQLSHLQAQINALNIQLSAKTKKLKELNQLKKQYVKVDQYKHTLHQRDSLQNQCLNQQDLQQQNQKLQEQKQQLQERISFLQSVDSEYINQKKSLIQELAQKYNILQSQKHSYNQQLLKYQQVLSDLQKQHSQGLQMSKKNSKKKRQPRHRKTKETKTQQILITQIQPQPEQKEVNRWKGKNLKRLCFIIFLMVLIIGVILENVIGHLYK